MPVLRRQNPGPKPQMVIGNHATGAGAFYESAYRWPWKIVRAPTAQLNAAQAGRVTGATGAAPPADARTVMLFNVVTDQYEKNDVSAKYPDITAQLVADLDAAPRAKESLSAAGQAGARGAGVAATAAAGARRGGGPGAAGEVIANDQATAAGGPQPAFRSITEEKGEPVAEASARASAASRPR